MNSLQKENLTYTVNYRSIIHQFCCPKFLTLAAMLTKLLYSFYTLQSYRGNLIFTYMPSRENRSVLPRQSIASNYAPLYANYGQNDIVLLRPPPPSIRKHTATQIWSVICCALPLPDITANYPGCPISLPGA